MPKQATIEETEEGVRITVPGDRAYDLDEQQMEEVTRRLKQPRAGGIAADQLRSIIGRVEKLEEEKAALAADIRDVYAEAKGNGFDTKTIRQIIKLRRMEAAEREEAETLLDTYMRALGMQTSMNFEREEQEDR